MTRTYTLFFTVLLSSGCAITVSPPQSVNEQDAGLPVPMGVARIYVDRQFDARPSTVSGQAGRVTFLNLFILNDGDGNGTLDRMVFNTRVVVMTTGSEERQASIGDAISGCDAVRDDRVLASGRVHGEEIVFDHAGIAVTTEYRGATFANFLHVDIVCDVRLNGSALPPGASLRVWLAADWNTGFTLVEAPPARVEGTLNLAQNTHGHPGTMYVRIVR